MTVETLPGPPGVLTFPLCIVRPGPGMPLGTQLQALVTLLPT